MFDLSLLNSGHEHPFRSQRTSSPEHTHGNSKKEAQPTDKNEAQSLHRLPQTSQQLDFSHKQSLNLQLQTKDGDQIQLSFSALNAQSQTLKPGSFQQTSIQANQLQISIEGDLSDAERADLSDFLQQVESLASTFYEGDLASAFSLAQEFDISGTELASFNLNLHTETQLRQVQEYRSVEGKPKLAPQLMDQMSGYLEQLRSTAEQADKLSPAQKLLEPVIDWLDQGDGLFSSLSKNYLEELMPSLNPVKAEDDG